MPQRYLNQDAAQEALQSAHASVHVRHLSRIEGHPLLQMQDRPVDLLVPARSDVRRTKRAAYHCWQNLPQRGAFVPAESTHVYVGDALASVTLCSPEFCFLQMASLVDTPELIEIGYELCGTYAISPQAENGIVSRAPVTTPRRLAAFVESAEDMPGILKARRAVKHVLAGSRSPKESQVAMQMTLPRTMGGFAVPRPLLNHEIVLPPDIAGVVGQEKIVPDLYWADVGTVLEYDSKERHDSYESVEHDARKRTAYLLMGLNVVSLTKSQFEDLGTVTKIALELRRRHGKQMRRPNERMRRARAKLHGYLLYGQRRERRTLKIASGELPQPIESPVTEVPWLF